MSFITNNNELRSPISDAEANRPSLSTQQKIELIATVASPIILLVGTVLTVAFLSHPIGQVVLGASGHVLTLPVVISAGTAAGGGIVVALQIDRRKKVAETLEAALKVAVDHSPSLQSLIRLALHPGREASRSPFLALVNLLTHPSREAFSNLRYLFHENTPMDFIADNHWEIDKAESFFNKAGGFKQTPEGLIDEKGEIRKPLKSVMYETREVKSVEHGVIPAATLGGYWYKNEKDADAPTKIVFHGQGCTADQSAYFAAYFKRRGYNVLLAEYRGYGTSGETKPASPNQEMEAILDMEAALSFVLRQGVNPETMGVYGFSLGSFYAAAAVAFYGVRFAVIDHGFDSLASAIGHHPRSPVSVETAGSLISSSYNHWSIERDPYIEAKMNMEVGGTLETDGFQVFSKLEKQKEYTHVLVIRGEKDEVISKKASEQLANSNQVITVSGKHNDFFNVLKEKKEEFDTFLDKIDPPLEFHQALQIRHPTLHFAMEKAPALETLSFT